MNYSDFPFYEPADLLLYVSGRGLVLKEKSLLAYDAVSSKVLAVGNKAERMIGNIPETARVLSPLRQGIIAGYMAAMLLLRTLIHKALGHKPLFRPGVAVCAPAGMSAVEIKALQNAQQAGISSGRVKKLLDDLTRRETRTIV